MNIYGVCKSCNNHLYLLAKVETRVALYKEMEPISKIGCNRCDVTTSFTINDLRAQLPKKMSQAIIESTLTVFIISLASYFLTTNMIYTTTILAICTIPVFIYILYIHKKRDKVLSFNKSKI